MAGTGAEPDGLFELPQERPVERLGVAELAPELPVARVLLETPVPHLDRFFDYHVTAEQDAAAQPGVRVRVPFGGRRMSGYLVERVAEPAEGVRPVPLSAVVSAERVLAPAVLDLCEDVAERYVGTVSDVVRAAVPPRVAKVEQEAPREPTRAPEGAVELEPEPPRGATPNEADAGALVTDGGPLADYDGGEDLLAELSEGASPHAVLTLAPGRPGAWRDAVAALVEASLASGRGAIVVVPDQRALDPLCAALARRLGEDAFARLTAEDGPTPRYRAFLRLARGDCSVAVGTRSAAYAPVKNLGLALILDDLDSSHIEPRAPYQHAREVLLLRATREDAALVVASESRSVEAERLVRTGWARDVALPRTVLRQAAPWVRASSDGFERERDPLLYAARLPRLAWEVAKRALEHGPVLVQVARRGFVPSLRCERCREPARCTRCQGPLALAGREQVPVCRWCGSYERAFVCPHCGDRRLRAGRIGADRTAEELGRAFPEVPVIRSTGAENVRTLGPDPALVVATPGAEPEAVAGYAAVLLLDPDAQLAHEGLRVGEEVLHRWFNASSLARSREDGGTVVLTGHPSPQGQALVRWDPAGAAGRELDQRAELGLPPAVRFGTLVGPATTVDAFVDDVVRALPEGALRRVGPTLDEEGEHRWILFFSHKAGPEVTAALRRRRGLGSLRRDPVVQIKVDDPAAL